MCARGPKVWGEKSPKKFFFSNEIEAEKKKSNSLSLRTLRPISWTSQSQRDCIFVSIAQESVGSGVKEIDGRAVDGSGNGLNPRHVSKSLNGYSKAKDIAMHAIAEHLLCALRRAKSVIITLGRV